MEQLIFYILALVSVVCALLVVVFKRAVYSALALVVCFASVALLFFQLGAQFIAAIQVIVYAGAIMVLFLFVVMLLDPETEGFSSNRLKLLVFLGIPAAALIAAVLFSVFAGFPGSDSGGQMVTSTADVANSLFKDYLLPFEVTSILILVAVVGAVVLSKRPHS